MAELMPWLEPLYRRFAAAMAAERAPQALMLGGPRGVGKEALAQALAQANLLPVDDGQRPAVFRNQHGL